MRTRAVSLLALVLLSAAARGANAPIVVTPPTGWSSMALDAKERASPYYTIKFAPDDHRNVIVLISYIGRGDGRTKDRASLLQIHTIQSTEFAAPGEQLNIHDLAMANGIGLYSTHEDPDLIGKPAPPNEYKVVTPVAILLKNGVVVVGSIYSDEVEGPTMTQALALVASVAPNATQTPAEQAAPDPQVPSILFNLPGFDHQMALPSQGLHRAPSLNAEKNYFNLVSDAGMNISGWLEPAASYKGLRALWAADKPRMEAGMGAKVEDEAFSFINGWQVVTYTLVFGALHQPNLRACRTAGNTWFDIHLSTQAGPEAKKALERQLRTIAVTPVAGK